MAECLVLKNGDGDTEIPITLYVELQHTGGGVFYALGRVTYKGQTFTVQTPSSTGDSSKTGTHTFEKD